MSDNQNMYEELNATEWTQYPDPTQQVVPQAPPQVQQAPSQQGPYQDPYQSVPQAPQQMPQQATAYSSAMGQGSYPQPQYDGMQPVGMQQGGGYMQGQPQPNYGQMQTPYGQGYAGQPPYGQYGGQYGQYGQQPYGQQQPYMMNNGVPMANGGYDPLAKNGYICLAIGIIGILLLFVGRVWGIIFCCVGISLGIKGIYSRAKVAAIIGIVLNSISLLVSILSLIATCAEMA